ncbi:MAG: hypothetical protein JXR96_07310 [Deltaproteobacteria bacterium]|nr:hypothetical protein [Deltaproteobacteria bacterium]
MGCLKNFRAYLDERLARLAEAESRLCELQEKLETYYQEIERVREQEFGQLAALLGADRGGLPVDLTAELDRHLDAERQAFDAKVAELRSEHDARVRDAEEERAKSLAAEREIRRKNRDQDAAEEELKARVEDLLGEIDAYNVRIRQMSSGFGFLANFFKVRRLYKVKKRLDQQHRDLAARIEDLRVKWKLAEEEFEHDEQQRKSHWRESMAEAAARQTKIDYLSSARSRIVQRGALERLLYVRRPELAEPASSDPACPRCGQPNPAASHFCRICAERLGEDRPDLDGSLAEMAELNLHFERFGQGMRACQEIIGLVRGLKTGLESFGKSVDDMLHNQSRYNLGPLDVHVPDSSASYGAHFDELADMVVDSAGLSLHPVHFAERIQALVGEVYTEDSIKAYFEAMGEELSAKAEASWG